MRLKTILLALLTWQTPTSYAIDCSNDIMDRLKARVNCQQGFSRFACFGLSAIAGTAVYAALARSSRPEAKRYVKFVDELKSTKARIAEEFKSAREANDKRIKEISDDYEQKIKEVQGQKGKSRDQKARELKNLTQRRAREIETENAKTRGPFRGDVRFGPTADDYIKRELQKVYQDNFPDAQSTPAKPGSKWARKTNTIASQTLMKELENLTAQLKTVAHEVTRRVMGRVDWRETLKTIEDRRTSRRLDSSAENFENKSKSTVARVQRQRVGAVRGGLVGGLVTYAGTSYAGSLVIRKKLMSCKDFQLTEEDATFLSAYVTLRRGTSSSCDEIEFELDKLEDFAEAAQTSTSGISDGQCNFITQLEGRLALQQDQYSPGDDVVNCKSSERGRIDFKALEGTTEGKPFTVGLIERSSGTQYGKISSSDAAFQIYLNKNGNQSMGDLEQDLINRARMLNPQWACSKENVHSDDDRRLCAIAKMVKADQYDSAILQVACSDTESQLATQPPAGFAQ